MAAIPTSHSAAFLLKPQTKHVVQDRPTPSPGQDDVLVKIKATAINPVDWKVQDYNLFVKSYPGVLGSDAAGEVVLAGSNVSVKPGDRVFFQGIFAGVDSYDGSTFQQYTKIPAALVGQTPANISDDEAAGISLASVAVVTGLYDTTGQDLTPPWAEGGSKIGAGKAAVILGGSSSVGQYAIQFARLSGFDRIITNSSVAHADHLKSLGATTVLDRSIATAMSFKEAAGDCEVSFVQDGISAKDTQILGVQILQEFNGGNVIIVLGPDDEAVKLGEAGKQVKIRQVVGLGSSPALRHLTEPLMKALGGEDGWLASGEYIPNRPEVVPGGLQGLEKALEKNKKGVSGVKVVIRPNDV